MLLLVSVEQTCLPARALHPCLVRAEVSFSDGMLSRKDVTSGEFMDAFLIEKFILSDLYRTCRGALLESHDAKGRPIFLPLLRHSDGGGACMTAVLREGHKGLVQRWMRSREREQAHRRLTLYAE